MIYRVLHQLHIPFHDPFSLRYYQEELLKTFLTESCILSHNASSEISLWNPWEENWREPEEPQKEPDRHILDALALCQAAMPNSTSERSQESSQHLIYTARLLKLSRVRDQGQQNGGSDMKHSQGFALLTTSFTIIWRKKTRKSSASEWREQKKVSGGDECTNSCIIRSFCKDKSRGYFRIHSKTSTGINCLRYSIDWENKRYILLQGPSTFYQTT